MLASKDLAQSLSTAGRRWRFAHCEFIELSRQLLVDGVPVKLESKPLDVLQLLLEQPASVLTKDELIGAAWTTATSDQSLATAVSKLRRAFGGTKDAIVLNVSGVGYRMAVPVSCTVDSEPGPAPLSLRAGDPIPSRGNWFAVRLLSGNGGQTVWLAEHCKTHEVHVFKFATDGVRLRALQREVVLSRLFQQTLKDDHRFVRILEWSFEQSPFLTESEYQGFNLTEFAGTDDFRGMPLRERIALAAEVSGAVAQAHGLGILHNDLKPSNILLMRREDRGGEPVPGTAAAAWQIKVVDFGVASLLDTHRLAELQITYHGEFDGADALTPASHFVGSAMYCAPESMLPGATPHMRGDTYALGVMLYQIACGDFLEPPSPGWESRIADRTLREDIAAAANIDPMQRLGSAVELAQRLERFDKRSADRQRGEEEQAARQCAALALARARDRRPWIVLAMIALVLGVATSLLFYRRAVEQRNTALARGATLAAMNGFLTRDLLSQTNPLLPNSHAKPVAEETLVEAINRALPQVDQRFASAPEVAGQIHETLAGALDARTRYAAAEQEYSVAASDFRRAEGPLSQQAIIAELHRENVEIRSQLPDAVAQAKAGFAQQQQLIRQVHDVDPELQGWQAMAETATVLYGTDPQRVYKVLTAAVSRANATPGFNPTLLTALELRFAAADLKLNRGADAERVCREMMAQIAARDGVGSPTLFQSKLFLEEALFLQHKYRETLVQSTRDYELFASTLGPQNQMTLSALDMRAQAEDGLHDASAAIRDYLALHAAAAAMPSAEFLAGDSLDSAAQLECQTGALETGLAHAEEVIREGRARTAPQPYLVSMGSLSAAECLLAGQETDAKPQPAVLRQASVFLAQVSPDVVVQFAGMSAFEGTFALDRARLAVLSGDLQAARQEASLAGRTFDQPDADPYRRRLLSRVTSEALAGDQGARPATAQVAQIR